jgi:hypothetical protein
MLSSGYTVAIESSGYTVAIALRLRGSDKSKER